MKRAFIVVNYGSHELVAENLSNLATVDDSAVVVVDNFSTVAERTAITQVCAEAGWELLALDDNAGFGAGVNAGVRYAHQLGATSFLAVNPDAVVSPEVAEELFFHLEEKPEDVVSPRIVTSENKPYFRGSMIDWSSGRMRGGWINDGFDLDTWRPWLTGASLGFSWQVFHAIDGFRDEYFLYWEDVDFARRAADAGFQLVLRDDLVAIHDEGGTQEATSSRAKSPTYYYWNTRNRLRFASQHLGRKQMLKWIATTPRESTQILLRGGRRQLVESPAPLSATIRGTLAGVGDVTRAFVRGGNSPVSSPASNTGSAPKSNAAHTSAVPSMAPAKVVIAHPSADLYGSDRVMLETVTGLINAGSEVTVTLPGDGPLVAEIRRRGAGVEFVDTPVLRKSFLSPTGLLKLAWQSLRSVPSSWSLLRRKGDVLVVNTVTIPWWIVMGRITGRSVIVHVHEAEKSISMKVKKLLYAPLLGASRLVVNSNFSLNVLTETYPSLSRRAEVVYNGVPGPDAPSDPRSTIDGPVEILFIGRLSPRKGPQVGLHAVRQLRDQGFPVRLSLLGAVFPGYEWFEQELRDYVEQHQLHDQVHFIGFDPSIWDHMAQSDIVLVPSTVDEPFGNTAVEAILAKRPLIVSKTSGLMEASSGFQAVRRVEPSDADAIANAAQELVADWESVIGTIDADHRLAVQRYAPSVYQSQMATIVSDYK